MSILKGIPTFSDLVEVIETELEELKSADHEETHSEDPLLQPLEPNHFTPKSSEAGNGSRLLILSAIVVVVLAVFLVPWIRSALSWKAESSPDSGHFDAGYYGNIDTKPPPTASLDSAPSMKLLRLHVIPHIATDWEALADILLNSPDSTSVTSQISANIPTVANRCAELLKTWLKNDADASWEQLLASIEQLGHKKLGKTIRDKINRREL